MPLRGTTIFQLDRLTLSTHRSENLRGGGRESASDNARALMDKDFLRTEPRLQEAANNKDTAQLWRVWSHTLEGTLVQASDPEPSSKLEEPAAVQGNDTTCIVQHAPSPAGPQTVGWANRK